MRTLNRLFWGEMDTRVSIVARKCGRTLLREMRHQGLLVRSAAKAIGVAHTTVQHALDGDNLDLSTSEKICKWLKIPLATLIDTNSGDDDHLEARLN